MTLRVLVFFVGRRVVASSCRSSARRRRRGQRRQRDSEQPPKRLSIRYADAGPCLRHRAGADARRGDPGHSRNSARKAAPRSESDETTIAQIHAAMKAGTPHAAVRSSTPISGASRRTTSAARQSTRSCRSTPRRSTRRRRSTGSAPPSGITGRLHCVPVIVKDNFETIGLQSAAGSLALKGFASTRDAFQVRRVKEAGAIVLAKSNMAEWAFTPYETVSSILPGYTRNPYALDRVTAGSSGGTAAAVAANLGAVGLGSDTGNSIRGPSSHQALVGIRSTMGLTSRSGVIPLSSFADVAGPMTRTVADAVVDAAGDRRRGSGRPDHDRRSAAGAIPTRGSAADHSRLHDGIETGRAERRASRRAPSSLRARHDGSGDREGLHRRARRDAESGRGDRGSCARAARRRQARGRRRQLRRLQVRHQPLSRVARRARAGEEPAGHHQVGAVPSDGAAPPRAGAAGHRERTGQRRRARPRRSTASRCARRSPR